MSTSVRSVTGAGPSALLVGLLSVLFVLPSHAGDCPAGKAGDNALPGAASAPVGVTEMELSSIDLGLWVLLGRDSRRKSRQAASFRCTRMRIGRRSSW